MSRSIMDPAPALCALGLLFASSIACSSPKKEAPEKEPPAATTATASGAVTASTAPPKAPEAAIPTLVPETVKSTKGLDFYPIEGAMIVVSGMRVGRLVNDEVEWIGQLPEMPMNATVGGTSIRGVSGKWPDVDIQFSSNSGRAAQPSVYPLTGKGSTVTFGPGGGLSWINGLARLGKTTIVGGFDGYGGSHFQTLRGPSVAHQPLTAGELGCKQSELGDLYGGGLGMGGPGVPFSGLAATEKGTLVTVGELCRRDKEPVAEVWDTPAKSRIIKLSTWIDKIGYFPKLLPGKGDELWIATSPVLRYNEGKIEPLSMPNDGLKNHFVSPSGKLHGISGRTIVRYDGGKWTPIAKLPRPTTFAAIAIDEKGALWVQHDGAARLREATAEEASDTCKTPFVYLYEVSWKNENKFSFPTTRKALATFPDVDKIKLVEYYSEYSRHLGIKVESEAQAQAVIAHVKANMEREHPDYVCYDPKNTRAIDIKTGK